MNKFRPHRDAEERRRSAICAAKAILGLDLYPAHKRQLLRVTLWKLTEAEADHKYRTRYRTAAALESAALEHDHVVQQASLLDALCAFPASADELLDCAIACTVTVTEHEALTEHSRLNPHIDGWNRYDALNLTVIDTHTGETVDLKALAKMYEHPFLAQSRAAARRASTWRQLFDELEIQYGLSGNRIANAPLRHGGKSLQIYFHDTVRKPPSFSAHEQFFSDFSWDRWESVSDATTKGYVHVVPECDFERDALAAMLQYAIGRT